MEKLYEANKLRLEANSDSMKNKSEQISKQKISQHSWGKCTFKSKNKSIIERHIKSIHEGVFYRCDQCIFKSSQKPDLKRQIETKHEGVYYSCDQCSKRASCKSELKRHIEAKHEGTHYSCD